MTAQHLTVLLGGGFSVASRASAFCADSCVRCQMFSRAAAASIATSRAAISSASPVLISEVKLSPDPAMCVWRSVASTLINNHGFVKSHTASNARNQCRSVACLPCGLEGVTIRSGKDRVGNIGSGQDWSGNGRYGTSGIDGSTTTGD